MNVVALDKIVAWLCDIYLSLLICFGNDHMFLIMKMILNCRSFQRTSNDHSEHEPETSQVKDTIAKERALEEYKENEPSSYEEVDKKKKKETMIKEYQKNNV